MNSSSTQSRKWSISKGWLVAGLLVAVALLGINGSRAQALLPTDWGTLINVPFPTTYAIYTQNFAYAEPFRVTDLRSSDTRLIEGYDMHTLDIYRPAVSEELLENRPGFFYVHGGGWTDGYKDRFAALSWAFTGQMGWITVVIDYRLASTYGNASRLRRSQAQSPWRGSPQRTV